VNRAAKIIILLGPPGSGKGTQAAGLAQALGLTAISTGEVLRRESDSGSDIGKQVHALLVSGCLVGNDLMNEMVASRLTQADCEQGCILDGYPRTIQQVRFLDSTLKANDVQEPFVFDFVVSPQTVIERLSHRRQCPVCGRIYSAEFDVYGKDLRCDVDGTPLVRRSDDNPTAIRERLEIYERNSQELVDFYKVRRYFAIDAMAAPESIASELLRYMQVLPTVVGGSVS